VTNRRNAPLRLTDYGAGSMRQSVRFALYWWGCTGFPNDGLLMTYRVLHLTTTLHISGPALQAILLTAKLRDLGYDTQLVGGAAPNTADSLATVAAHYGVTPLVLPEMGRSLNPLHHWRVLVALVRCLRELQPHIVHTHTTTAGWWGRLAARLAGVPIVVHTLHEHPFRGYYPRWSSVVFVWVERGGAYFADSIITLSEKLRRDLTEKYRITRRQKITILPAGYDLQRFTLLKRHSGSFRQAWGIAPDAPLVGIVGRLLPVKNHTLFLTAAQQLRQTLPTVQFAVVGDGELRSTLEAQARELGLAECVHFTGWQADVAPLYSDADVIVISSLNEGTPVPLMEALAAGCPVVATNVGGVADLLSGTSSRLVPTNDVAALTAALLATLAEAYDPEPARTIMLQRYSLERLAHDLDSLYRGLLTMKHVRP
jgi:glycosyltransferase involved in cell wall biosynthesis